MYKTELQQRELFSASLNTLFCEVELQEVSFWTKKTCVCVNYVTIAV